MKTRLFGAVEEVTYSVKKNTSEYTDKDGKKKEIFTASPRLRKNKKIVEWKEICSYTGLPHYNDSISYHGINISENEKVCVTDEIFRADLGEYHLHTDKILETIEKNKDVAELAYNAVMKTFNKTMIESNDKMKSYCNLHKLNPEETDCKELFKLLYPNEEMEIINGKMCVNTSYSAVKLETISVSSYVCGGTTLGTVTIKA